MTNSATPPPPEAGQRIAEDSEISLTFRKGMQVMQAFDGKDRLMSLAEIARKAGLNPAVTRRLVRTLLQNGMLIEKGQRYEMTVGVMRLARGFLDGHGIAQVIQPILRKSAAKIGENIKIRRFERFVMGEGLEKKQDDFAAEVAAAVQGAG